MPSPELHKVPCMDTELLPAAHRQTSLLPAKLGEVVTAQVLHAITSWLLPSLGVPRKGESKM